ncbi:TPA: DUF6731 family protein [Clostridioides difficile]
MGSKTIKVFYYYPIIKTVDTFRKERIILYDLNSVLEKLKNLNVEDRVFKLTDEENIQLKLIEKENENKWKLGFLKNSKDSIFKSKLEEVVKEAESLDDDEFIGQECCMIYDKETGVISLQNNRKSVSFKNISSFMNEFIEKYHNGENIELYPITLKPEYSNISDLDTINYKSISLSFLDISEIKMLAREESIESVESIAKMSNNLEALSGKIELSVGWNKNRFLEKINLREIVSFFKRHPKLTRGIKVKSYDYDKDEIRVIDLIENKLYDEFSITVTKNKVKTFEKIFLPMSECFDVTVEETLDDCNKVMEEVYV